MNRSQRLIQMCEATNSNKWVVYKSKIDGDEFQILQKDGKWKGDEKNARIFPTNDEAMTWIQDEGEKQGWVFKASIGSFVDKQGFEYYQDTLDNTSNESVDIAGYKHVLSTMTIPELRREAKRVNAIGAEALATEIANRMANATSSKDRDALASIKMKESLNEEGLPTKLKIKPDNWGANVPLEISYNDKTGRFMVNGDMYTLEPANRPADETDSGSKYDTANLEDYILRGDAWAKSYRLGSVSKWKHEKEFTASGSAIEREDVNKFAAAAKLILNIV